VRLIVPIPRPCTVRLADRGPDVIAEIERLTWRRAIESTKPRTRWVVRITEPETQFEDNCMVVK
jgi:hypothetical protein